MKAWQKIIKEQKGLMPPLFLLPDIPNEINIKTAIIRETDYETAKKIILEYEWLGTIPPNCQHFFGIFFDNYCGGIVVYGDTTTQTIKESIAGKKNVSKVIQLQRGATVYWAHPHSASKLISKSLQFIEKLGYRIVVAFADPQAGEIGTVYQATNWLYCGLTEIRPDYFDENGNRLTGHVGKIKDWMLKADRPRKHRYIKILGTKKEQKQCLSQLQWPILSYPKRAEDDSRESCPDTIGEGGVRFPDSAIKP